MELLIFKNSICKENEGHSHTEKVKKAIDNKFC